MAGSVIPNGATRLAKKIADALRSSLSVNLWCEPAGVGSGEKVLVTATFSHPERSRFALKPLVKCEENPQFELLLKDNTPLGIQEKTFSGEFDSGLVGVSSGDVTLTLVPAIGQPAIASTTLHVFSPDEIAAAKSILSETEP